MLTKLKVFYDGACHLCYREVQHYKKKDKRNLLEIIDISSTNFCASDYGLDETSVNLHLHSLDESGNVYKGVDCFIEIWKRIPNYKWIIPAFESKLTRPIIDKSYDIFARKIRPRLPKRKCESGSCKL